VATLAERTPPRHMMGAEGDDRAFRRVPPEEIDALLRYDWPGNARELRSLVTTALAMNRGRSGPMVLTPHLNDLQLRKPAGSALADSRYISWRSELNHETVRIYLRMLRIGEYGKTGRHLTPDTRRQ